MFGSFGLNSATLKATLKKYGRTGLVTYLGLSSMVTTGKLYASRRGSRHASAHVLLPMLLPPHCAARRCCHFPVLPLPSPSAIAF
jgi:hypothetical protein